jgi:NADH dehydrogenase
VVVEVISVKPALFVTGATGLVGTRLLSQLDPDCYSTITLLCRSDIELPAQLAVSGKVTVLRAALNDVDSYQEHLTPQTCIVHLAAITGKADRPQYFAVNTHATGLLIKAAEHARVRGFLFVSSIAVSFAERSAYHYAESKEQAEALLRDSALRFCIVRPTIILADDAPVWQSFYQLAQRGLIVLPGNGRTLIQPIYIDDLVRLFEEIVANNRFAGETIEIGGPEALSLDDFVSRIHLAATGKQARILHLPLGLILGPLRLLESFMAAHLPVSSGQFASFHNDGTVRANSLVKPAGSEMLDVDAMLVRLLEAEDGPAAAELQERECCVFSRYLTGQPPEAGVCDKYSEALTSRQHRLLEVHGRFDALLLTLAAVHPLLTRFTDIYSRYCYSDSVLRRRLIMLLAILETRGSVFMQLDSPNCAGKAGLLLGMSLRGAISALLLSVALITLLPLQLLLGRHGDTGQAG